MAASTHRGRGVQDEMPPEVRCCEWPGCSLQGEYPAPRSPRMPKPYRWFCLEHVREYNATWNYYEGMSDDEVEADRRRDTVWQRPSWRLGGGLHHHGAMRNHLRDDFGFFGDGFQARPEPRPTTPEQEALSVLDLSPPVTVAAVKARYKQLVKRHHPDANGGDKMAEERFKVISAAYRTVLDSLTA